VLGDVEWDVAAHVAGAKQNAGLRGGAGTDLDELAGARHREHVGGRIVQDRELGPSRVVLGQLGDPLEQLGAARVVQVLGRQFLERTRETVEDVLGQ
jgi:hypothetical protein